MLYEVTLVLSEFLPIFGVLTQIDFVHCPEASHLVLVHLPNILVLDGKNHKAVGVIF